MPQASSRVAGGNSATVIYGWDARIIAGSDESALLRLWREKRGEADPIRQRLVDRLGRATFFLNCECYRVHTGHAVSISLEQVWLPGLFWMEAFVQGVVEQGGALFEAAYLPTSVTKEEAAEIYMPRLQHTMLLARRSQSVLSVITGDGRWFATTVEADPVYQTALIAAEKAFWQAVHFGRPPRLFGPMPRRSGGQGVRPPTTEDAADPAACVVLPMSVDKSELTIGEPRRRRDKDHLGFVASQACLVCGRKPCEAHHLRFAQPRALGRKVSDEFTVPLCRLHHRKLHAFGSEARWWNEVRVDPLPVARELWAQSRQSRQSVGRAGSELSPRDTEAPESGALSDQPATPA